MGHDLIKPIRGDRYSDQIIFTSFPSLHHFENGYLLSCESPNVRGPVIYFLDHNLKSLIRLSLRVT